jgi:hypothetical protein
MQKKVRCDVDVSCKAVGRDQRRNLGHLLLNKRRLGALVLGKGIELL